MTWYLVSSNFLQLNLAQSVVECVQLTAVEVNGLTSKQETLTPRRTQGGSSWGNAALQIPTNTKRVSVALPASQPTPASGPASQAVASTETVYSCNALQCIAKFVSKVYFENSGNFKDRKTGAELSAVSDRSVKEGVAWSLEIGAGI